MTQPTRQQILNAHEALEELKNVALSAADFCGDTEKYLAWKSEIIAALPPKPQPTMAEVEWDDDKHYLAEAETEKGLKAIMLHPVPDMGILCLEKEYGAHRPYYFKADYLTPTGKRYTLTEVHND